MEALILKVALWVLTVAGGAVGLENFLENYLIDKVPAWAKGLVSPIVSAVFGIIMHLQAGLPFEQAMVAALGLHAGTTLVHNHPNLTSASWPTAPLDAAGVPGSEG